MNKFIISALCATVLLAGCSSREEADKKIAKGCQAGVASLLAMDKYDRQLDRVKHVTYAKDDLGRKVTLETAIKNKAYGYAGDETFSCIFSEEYSFGFIAYKATLERLTIGTDVYGRDEKGEIQGELNDYMRLTDAVQKAMDEADSK